MPRVTRRDIVATLGSALMMAATPGGAVVCNDTLAGSGALRRKSYTCKIGAGKSVTTTFLRVSDLTIDSLGRGTVPDAYKGVLDAMQLVDNPTLQVFTDLFERFSYPFSKDNLGVTFDGRQQGVESSWSSPVGYFGRMRTLGAWDSWGHDPLPIFPLPDALRQAIANPPPRDSGQPFLRYARPEDFSRLEDKMAQYSALWFDHLGPNTGLAAIEFLGNLKLMEHIGAGNVDQFLPLMFSSVLLEECSGTPHGGAHYIPPGMYVDIAHCTNTGQQEIVIDDFLGAGDKTMGLRAYSSETPSGAAPLGLAPVRLRPGESTILMQRLLFSADVTQREWGKDSKVKTKRAVFGPTQLPKGLVVDGEAFDFDGRSHNALIMASYSDGASCPFLFSWCDISREWVKLGKVLVGFMDPDADRTDTRSVPAGSTRFKLVEREHERSYVTGLLLQLTLTSGETVHLPPETAGPAPSHDDPVIINIGQSFEFSFDLPDEIDRNEITETQLVIGGYYQIYSQKHVDERRLALQR